jgi:hypothetical protein
MMPVTNAGALIGPLCIAINLNGLTTGTQVVRGNVVSSRLRGCAMK